MGRWIRRSRIWRFWGAPIFSPEVPNSALIYIYIYMFFVSRKRDSESERERVRETLRGNR